MNIRKFLTELKFWWNDTKDNAVYGHIGRDCRIIKPMRVIGKKRIFIGDNVTILNMSRLETIRSWGGIALYGRLRIGNGTSIEQCCHIIAANNVQIGCDCVFSSFVYISDCAHAYNPKRKILESNLEIKPVKIGDHCFIGIGSCILPGSTLGNNVVIGANSVVIGNIPDNSMAVGSPAHIIKKYNLVSECWESI